MLYAIIARDVPNSVALRPSVRPRHLQYLQPLIDQGRVVFAGPHPAIDSPEPGPCGHVYTDHADIGPHTLTITATWRSTRQLSNGRTGQLADIVTTAQHDYAVYEVQTVGVSG